jgi:hypothetical protein
MRFFLAYGCFGTLFGVLLSRTGATSYDAVAGMFLFTDFQLWGVIGVAVLVAGTGQAVFRRLNLLGASLPTAKPKPIKPTLLAGAVLFGTGWAVTGTCPGTGLAQIGEGKLIGFVTVAGILAGSALYRVYGDAITSAFRFERRAIEPGPSC